MKKYIVLIMLLFLSNVVSFGNWGTKFVNNRTNYFKDIEGVWVHEQELSGIFEIKKIGKDWYYIEYNFAEGTYEKHKMNYLKNGTFLKIEEDGDVYYIGYDMEVDEIITVGTDMLRQGGSGRMYDEVKKIYSKEGYTNVRTGPSSSNKAKAKIPNGTNVVYAEYSEHNQDNPNSDWWEVMYFNYEKGIVGEGFVHKSQIVK